MNGGSVDSASTTFVMSSQGFGSAAIGNTVATWSYYGGRGGLNLTPVLFEYSGSGNNYVVRGVGTTVTTTLGANLDLPFNLVSGSTTITNGNFFFGWKDGTPSTPNQGSISFANNAGSPQVLYFSSSGPSGFALSNTYSFTGGPLDRTYSISASAIPEPSVTAALFALAALGCAVWHRRTMRCGTSESPGAL